ncbi:Carnosine N-methyltransferase [Vitis vinifera]|uniref:Carnosine N-methyltransferase n=1 Tax=Vitis vinifera TaxID=29760 RepID=A0A438IGT4_VITVI|nr:Carnosine N-methyltransferase [Vitis vinifera]
MVIAGVWDAVVTCFFIDTAHNIVEYIEIISRILKDGGVWINFGPLLYHFADMYGQEDEMSIELSLEDVKKVALHYGFQMEKERTIETTYTTNPRSMMQVRFLPDIYGSGTGTGTASNIVLELAKGQNRYFAAFWTMRKKPVAT